MLRRGGYFITASTPKPQPGQGRLNVDAIEVKIDPAAEWKQIFDEAWRINRDYFYATNMHGADWPAMKKKYEVFLPHLSCRGDLNRVIQWMCSELGVGHHRVGGGDCPVEPKTVPGGLLGADYAVENGRYRFKKVYGGLNWNPELRSPLTEPGVDVGRGRISAGRQRQGPPRRRPISTPVREHGRQDRRDHGRPEPRRDRLARPSRSCPSPANPPSATATGSRATSRKSSRRRADGWPTSMSRTRARSGHDLFQALFLSPGRQGGDHRR